MAARGSGGRLGGRLLVAAALAGAPLACSLLTSYGGLTAQPGERDGGSTDAPRPDGTPADAIQADSATLAEAGPCEPGMTACGATCVDLTGDPANCGRCGRDCLGGACTMGMCDAVTLATSQSTPGAIIAVNDSLYWGNATEIMRCSLLANGDDDAGAGLADASVLDASPPDGGTLDGGTADASPPDGGVFAATCTASVTSYQSAMHGGLLAFAADATKLYWLDNLDLWSCPFGPTCPSETPLMPYLHYVSPAPQGRGVQLIVGGGALYWPVQDGIEACSAQGSASPTSFATASTASGLALAGGTAYWGTGQAIDDCVAGDGMCPAVMSLVSVSAAPFYLASDGTTVYWTEQAGGAVQSCPVAGCSAVTQVAQGQLQPAFIAADASGVYWVNSGLAPAIKACPPGPCTNPTVLWTGADAPAGLAIDANAVYFTLPGASTVMAVAKL